ncbi:MAG: RNA degradosome polyphosphate kinase, partial [Terriglobales bacterium]
MARLALDNPANYINREASWLAFNRRVLEEAQDHKNPLLERLKFLSISASNLDEFFEVRVAGLVQQIEDGYTEAGPDGLTLLEERDVVSRDTHEFVDDQYHCWNQELRPA